MELWELVLFLLAYIAGGCLLYILLCRLISLFVQEPQNPFGDFSTLSFISATPEAPPVVQQRAKLTDPRLVAEINNNLRITTEPWSGDLIPFDTQVWDAQQYEVYQLPTDLQNDLSQVYADIRLANHIVWFSTEFNHRSQHLGESYTKIRTSIAERLHRITQNVQ